MTDTGVIALDHAETTALTILGGRDYVCAQIRGAIESSLEKDKDRVRELAAGAGIADLNALLTKLSARESLDSTEALGTLHLLSGIGEALNQLLPIAQEKFTEDRQAEIESMMNEQKSGPRYADSGVTKFDPDSAIRLFIRLQAIEDLCK